MSDDSFKIEIVEGDVLDYEADVLALKYAQHYYGSDQAVAARLVKKGVAVENDLKPPPGKWVWVDPGRVLPNQRVLFIGVPPLIHFGYGDIADWARQVISITGRDYPETHGIAITLHGPGFGLDEIEALYAEVRGIHAALQAGHAAAGLRRVCIVDHKRGRVERLRKALADLDVSRLVLSSPVSSTSDGRAVSARPPKRRAGAKKGARPGHRPPAPKAWKPVRSSPGTELESSAQVESKPRVFVAIPLAPEMEDVFYYGIQNPVRALGYICERVDQEAFTGDILQQVRMRIENAEIVIADLTGANANVYLEVGYAWGKARPTVLLANKKDELRFDVSGQRCLKYQSIKDLETLLTQELQSLGKNRKP